MKKKKLYFKSINDTVCLSLESHLQDAKLEELDKITLIEAVPDHNNPDYIFCVHEGEIGERQGCKKSICSLYSSKSGRGTCKHRGRLFQHGNKVEFDIHRTIKPIRIQRKREKGWRKPENTICVNRGTKWGNPFKIGEFLNVNNDDGSHTYILITRDLSIEYFRAYITQKIDFGGLDLTELKGKNLACFCKENEACHAEVLLELANV